jgi:hypothetical protein
MPVLSFDWSTIVEQVKRLFDSRCASVQFGLNLIAPYGVGDVILDCVPQVNGKRVTVTIQV